MIGGNFNVLSTDIFFAVVGAAHDQGRAAVLAMVLLGFTLTAFLAQRPGWQAQLRDRDRQGRYRHSRLAAAGAALRPAPRDPAVADADRGGLWHHPGRRLRRVGRPDYTPTLTISATAFSIEQGVGGWFLSGSGLELVSSTTIELAQIAMPLTALLGLLTAYLLDRQDFRGTGSVRVPGA